MYKASELSAFQEIQMYENTKSKIIDTSAFASSNGKAMCNKYT